MVTSSQTPFRQRICKATDCGALFFICSHCDRGQLYCSARCQQLARRCQWRAASRRHQQSAEGRLDHRDRQRLYRQRQAQATAAPTTQSVTHQGSQTRLPSATMALPCKRLPEPVGWQRFCQALFDSGFLVCHFCGRLGRFLNPFHEAG